MFAISYRIGGDNICNSIEDSVQELSITAMDACQAYEKKTGETFDEYIETVNFNKYIKTCLWNRKNNNHAVEYFKDMETLMNQDSVHDNEFILFHEDDWIINTQKPLMYLLQEGIRLMKGNKDILCVRINADTNTDLSKASKITK